MFDFSNECFRNQGYASKKWYQQFDDNCMDSLCFKASGQEQKVRRQSNSGRTWEVPGSSARIQGVPKHSETTYAKLMDALWSAADNLRKPMQDLWMGTLTPAEGANIDKSCRTAAGRQDLRMWTASWEVPDRVQPSQPAAPPCDRPQNGALYGENWRKSWRTQGVCSPGFHAATVRRVLGD